MSYRFASLALFAAVGLTLVLVAGFDADTVWTFLTGAFAGGGAVMTAQQDKKTSTS